MLKGLANALDAAREYLARGWKPVPVPIRKKKAILPRWQELRLEEDTVEIHFARPSNIGLLLGNPSNELVDVDIDSAEALSAADEFLPPTGLVHGRRSKPRSHRYYVSRGARTQKFEYLDGRRKTMFVELRATKCQTIVPPSLHPTGEPVYWETDGAAAVADAATLSRQLALLATTALLARHWPGEGVRHDLSLALAGLLLMLGVSEANTGLIITMAARASGDSEWAERGSAAGYTAARISSGAPATGGPTVEQLLAGNGGKIVATIRRWLHAPVIGTVPGAGIPSEPGLPKIDAGDLNLPVISTLALEALQTRNNPPFIFRFGNQIVRSQDGDEGELVLRPVGPSELRHELVRSAVWFKRGKGGKEKLALPPGHVVTDMLASPGLRLPVLRRIVETPVFTAQGVLHTEPGYEPAAGLLYRPTAQSSMPAVSAAPGSDEIREAVRWIAEELFVDFPFVSEADRAHAFALYLLVFLRDLINGPTPLHAVDKPSPGTGAGLLTDVLARIATGREAAVMPTVTGEDEWRKTITSCLMTSPTVILIDNVRTKLSSSSLAAALTAPTWSDRVLGKSQQIILPVRCTWIATGNNLAMSDEIARRTIRIRMDAKTDQPWERDGFKHSNLRQFVDQNRGRFVWAGLTMIRGWLVAGRPMGRASLGGYESWAAVVGGVLEIAGISGFLQNVQAVYEEANEQSVAWRAFISDWSDRFGDRPVGVADVWAIAFPPNSTPLDLGLGVGPEHALKTRLGGRLREHKDRYFGDLQLVSAGTAHSARMWRVVGVNGTTPPAASRSTASQHPPPVTDIADVLEGWAATAFSSDVSAATSSNLPHLPTDTPNAERVGEPGEPGEVPGRSQTGTLWQAPNLQNVQDVPPRWNAGPSVVSPFEGGFPFPSAAVRRLRQMGFSDPEIRTMTVETSLKVLLGAGCTSLTDV